MSSCSEPQGQEFYRQCFWSQCPPVRTQNQIYPPAGTVQRTGSSKDTG